LRVVVVVARGAARDRRDRIETRRGGVAGDAPQPAVPLVLELRGVQPHRSPRDGDARCDRLGAGKLRGRVTRAAIARLGRLVVADLAAARGLKRQSTAPGLSNVAGQAGELFVTGVRKGIGGGGLTAARVAPRRRVVEKRSVTS
jgi:hypothetical protein